MTTELEYGIRAQPGDTCPMINDALGIVSKINKIMRGYEKADEDELRDMLSAIEMELGELSGYGQTGLLEDIRNRTIEIRAWGQEWKDFAKEKIQELEDKE